MLNSKNQSSLANILEISIPAAFKNSLDTIQVLVGLMMVGSLGVNEIAAVGLGIQFLMATNIVMTIYIAGGNALISRYIGSGRFHRANKSFYSAFFLSLVLSIAVSIFGFFYTSDFYILMGSTNTVTKYGEDYFEIICLGMPLYFLDALFFNAYSAAARTKASFVIKIVTLIINVILNYALIFGHFGLPKMGVKGVAISMVASYFVSVAIYCMLLANKKSVIKFHPKVCAKQLSSIVRIGLPSAFERLIYISAFMYFVKIIANFSVETLAGYQIGLRIEGIAFMAGVGFSIAAMSLTGQALGQKNKAKAYNDVISITKIACYLMGLSGLFMIFSPELLASPFTSDENTIEQACIYLRLVGASQLPLAIIFVLTGAFKGAGATKLSLFLNIMPLIFLRVIPATILSKITNDVFWIYLVITAETYIKCGLFVVIFRQGKWMNTRIN